MKRFQHRLITCIVLGVAIFLLTTACHQTLNLNNNIAATSTGDCRPVKHPMGETCIPLHPQRIVAIDILSLSNLIALGIKPAAGWIWSPLSEQIDLPEHLASRVSDVALYGYSADQPNLESILKFNPDLIVSPSGALTPGAYQQLSQIAPTVFVPWQEISRSWKQNLIETAKVFDKVDVANQLLDDYYRRVETLKQNLGNLQSTLNRRDRPFYAEFIFTRNGLMLAGKNSFSGTILNDLGLLSPQAPEGILLPMSEEKLPEIDADALFVGAHLEQGHATLKRLQNSPLWSRVNAVQQNQAHLVDFFSWYGFEFLSAHAVLDDIEKHLLGTHELR
ncbi:iron-siderophore ABC transporter substrate-binding protein [Leptolyngbya sp. O-77]|uniref:iron-siderophore ABC transporter substrate-binding protein n=1 Tax=Leptolyngbya sp. O-77 TaxID=1080068 RepID=UPI00074D29B6|nr:ABC transporter substrate-binding protein [Leptolyngbya sp. O-77]BAU40259.1 putative siderophore-binding lipoprotein YfiY precursor [Leptolyngbya sp. O-77]